MINKSSKDLTFKETETLYEGQVVSAIALIHDNTFAIAIEHSQSIIIRDLEQVYGEIALPSKSDLVYCMRTVTVNDKILVFIKDT